MLSEKPDVEVVVVAEAICRMFEGFDFVLDTFGHSGRDLLVVV